ncbi:MAG: restriction endonuclease [Thermodesulfobacteriota bacterium]
MSKTNYQKGKDYEDFVEKVYQAILDGEVNAGVLKPVTLERNRTLPCKSGATAEMDIYWEYEAAEVLVKVGIECKDTGAVSVGDMRDFIQKLEGIGGIQGLFFSKDGFQDGAKKEAAYRNITLLKLREVEEKDWDGYLKEIYIEFNVLPPARIVNIEPALNEEWLRKQGYKEGDRLDFSALNTEMILEDKKTNFKYSLHEIVDSPEFSQSSPGEHIWEKSFEDGWFYVKDKEVKIDSMKITYQVPSPFKQSMLIDHSKWVLAVLENVEENKQYLVSKDGRKKKFS